MNGMTEPALSDKETLTLIDYARHKFAEVRWPMSPSLRAMRAIMEELDPKPELLSAPRARVEPSWRMARKRRRGLGRERQVQSTSAGRPPKNAPVSPTSR